MIQTIVSPSESARSAHAAACQCPWPCHPVIPSAIEDLADTGPVERTARCTNTATQEDALCDPCRSSNATSVCHCSGIVLWHTQALGGLSN